MKENLPIPKIIRYPELESTQLEELTNSIMLFQPFHGHDAYKADDSAISVMNKFNHEKQRFSVQSLISTIHGDFQKGMPEKEYLRTTKRTHRNLFKLQFGIPVYYFPKIAGKGHAGTTKVEFVQGLHRFTSTEHPLVVIMESGFKYSEFVEVYIEEIAPGVEICPTLEIGINAACHLLSKLHLSHHKIKHEV